MKNVLMSFLLPLLVIVSSCSKSTNNNISNTAPTNLTVTANVSTDSSGNVSFIAAATNATSYDFDFGDGGSLNVVSGITTYKYANSGTYTVNVIAKNASGLIITKSIQVTVVVAQTAIWSDEFNINGVPDPSKWTYDLGANNGWGNSEQEYYTNRPSNVSVQNGVLKITATKESYNGSSYTSARIKSQGLYAFTYGRIEISAKLPSALGTWPALWMLGSDITNTAWPACGEMDIMEQKGNQLNKIYGTIHYPGHSGGGGIGSTLMISNSSTQFHKYTLDWSAAAIKMYVDNVLYLTVPNTNSLPFNQNFFFILNVAMGGTFGGTIDPAFTSDSMEVDYIRVYK